MTARHGAIARARRIAEEDESRVRAEIARYRRSAGLSQAALGQACGLSRSAVARTEDGTRRATLAELACLAAAVGLDVRLRAFRAGDPIRDAGQLRLLERLRRELHPSLRWSTEVPLPIPGDLRAWDALIRGDRWLLGVEAETVIDDIQALERRLSLKVRDGQVDGVILVVADTPRNRRALSAAREAFADLPLRTRSALGPLRNGTYPGASGIVVI